MLKQYKNFKDLSFFRNISKSFDFISKFSPKKFDTLKFPPKPRAFCVADENFFKKITSRDFTVELFYGKIYLKSGNYSLSQESDELELSSFELSAIFKEQNRDFLDVTNPK